MPAKSTARNTPLALPTLKKSELYVGVIIGADGKGHHIILLPGDEPLKWKEAMAWAKKKGGDLPNRIEQALLFRDHKGEFQETWYWSNTPHASDADYAWYQSSDNGYQDNGHKSNAGRCRAVRRVAI